MVKITSINCALTTRFETVNSCHTSCLLLFCSVYCVAVKESKPLDITFSAGVELLEEDEKEVSNTVCDTLHLLPKL